MRINVVPTGIRPLARPARSESPYLLSCPQNLTVPNWLHLRYQEARRLSTIYTKVRQWSQCWPMVTTRLRH